MALIIRCVVFLCIAIVSLVDVYYGSPVTDSEPAGPLGMTLAVIVAVGLFVYPWYKDRALFVACCALTAMIFISNVAEMLLVGPPVLYGTYLAAAYSNNRNVWLIWALTGVTAAQFSGVSFVHIDSLRTGVIVLVSTFAIIGFVWLLGLNKRRQFADMVAMKERAELAATLERTHIARELHDIVGHNLTSVIALADGARFAAANDPQIAVDTLKTIADSSRAALQQVRGLVTLLRDDARPRLAPSSAGIPVLIEDAKTSGFHLSVTGEVPEHLEPATGFVLFRTVQELLTNMIRHAATPYGTLIFEHTMQGVKVLAENDCAGEASEGMGLMGLRERVQAIGGSVRTKQADGRFYVQVVIPQ